MQKAVFLDRDGTINEEMGYINHLDRFRMFSFVPEAVKILNEANFKVFVVTNQSGVARGYFDENLVKQVHRRMLKEMELANAKIDKIYYCPHHPTEGIGKYKRDCDCRKPKTGMIEQAVRDFGIDLNGSFMVGDRYKDTEFALKAGLIPVFVKTGYGLGEYTFQKEHWKRQPAYIAENVLEAAKYIKKLTSGAEKPNLFSD